LRQPKPKGKDVCGIRDQKRSTLAMLFIRAIELLMEAAERRGSIELATKRIETDYFTRPCSRRAHAQRPGLD